MRLRSRWAIATRLPSVCEATATTASSVIQRGVRTGRRRWPRRARASTTSAAPLGTTERNAVTGVGDTLVDVGRPGVERHQGELEAEAGEHQRQAGEHQRLPGQRGRCARASATDGSEKVPVAPYSRAMPKSSTRGGERADHEVLEAGLQGDEAVAVEGVEDVERDREQLEADEDGQQVVRLGHHHGADGGPQQQRRRTRRSGALVRARYGSAMPRPASSGRQDVGVDEAGQRVDQQGARPDGAGQRLDPAQRASGDGVTSEAGSQPKRRPQRGREGVGQHERGRRRATRTSSGSNGGEVDGGHASASDQTPAHGRLRERAGRCPGGRRSRPSARPAGRRPAASRHVRSGERRGSPRGRAGSRTRAGPATACRRRRARCRGDDDHGGHGWVANEPGEDEELADEAVEAGQADGAQGGERGTPRCTTASPRRGRRSPRSAGCGGARRSRRRA